MKIAEVRVHVLEAALAARALADLDAWTSETAAAAAE